MRTVKLVKFALGRFDNAGPFPIGDLDLCLDGLPRYPSADIRLIAKINGVEVAKIAVSEVGNTVKIPQDLIECGELSLSVVVYSRGTKVEEYAIEPLSIIDVEGKFFADPVIHQLEQAVDMLTGDLKEAKNRISLLESECVKLKEENERVNDRIDKLYDFAKACIGASPYINDYKFEEE